jgi:hypothetical protein
MRSFAEWELQRHPWDALREASGTARNVPQALRKLFAARSPDEAEKAYWQLENHVVVQGQLFESAEHVVPVLLAALLDELPRHVRISVLELLFQIVAGETHDRERELGNASLSERCRQSAREGLWLLYGEWLHGERDAAGDVIERIERDPGRLAALRGS